MIGKGQRIETKEFAHEVYDRSHLNDVPSLLPPARNLQIVARTVARSKMATGKCD
jgi:hypothetical protein